MHTYAQGAVCKGCIYREGEVRKVLMDVVWREVRGEWKKEAQKEAQRHRGTEAP